MKQYITHANVSADGDITAICNKSRGLHRSKQEAMADIRSGRVQYFVPWKNYPETEIKVVQGPTGPYLRTDRDRTSRNNLEELASC